MVPPVRVACGRRLLVYWRTILCVLLGLADNSSEARRVMAFQHKAMTFLWTFTEGVKSTTNGP